jgi:TonB family protein
MAFKAATAILVLTLSASANAQEQNGKIVFYRESHFLNNDFKPPLFCDGVELARMLSGSYLEVIAQPGRHECVAESPQGPATTIEIVSGGIAYQRVVITSTVKRHAVLTASSEEEYRKQKNLTRIATAVSDSVQPLVPVDPAPPIAPTNPDRQARLAKVTEPEGVFQPGVNGVTFPRCVYCPDPPYTPQARAAKLNGTVELKVVIGANGTVRNIEIVKGPGKGLDEEAVFAIQRWRFQPAVGPNGEPVAVIVPIEVTFRMLK